MSAGLVTSDVPLSDEVRTFLERSAALYATGDDDALVEGWFCGDCVFRDHRPVGGGDLSGTDEIRQYLATTRDVLPDFRIAIHVRALEGLIYLARDSYAGSASLGGGPAEVEWWVVDQLRDGRLAREHIYTTEEEARTEFERLTA